MVHWAQRRWHSVGFAGSSAFVPADSDPPYSGKRGLMVKRVAVARFYVLAALALILGFIGLEWARSLLRPPAMFFELREETGEPLWRRAAPMRSAEGSLMYYDVSLNLIVLLLSPDRLDSYCDELYSDHAILHKGTPFEIAIRPERDRVLVADRGQIIARCDAPAGLALSFRSTFGGFGSDCSEVRDALRQASTSFSQSSELIDCICHAIDSAPTRR